MFPSFEILGGFYYFLRILWLFQKLFVCLCAHMHIMCACICQNWYLKETPQDDWMQPNSLLYSLSPFPIFLSFPSLSVFPSPIPPLTQSFLKVNPRGIFFSAATFWFYVFCLWPCSWVLVLGQCWEMAALVTGPTKLAFLISAYFLRLVFEISACFLRLVFMLILPPKADFWQTRLFELRVFCGQ